MLTTDISLISIQIASPQEQLVADILTPTVLGCIIFITCICMCAG